MFGFLKKNTRKLGVHVISDGSHREVQAVEVAKRLGGIWHREGEASSIKPDWPQVVIGAGEGTVDLALMEVKRIRDKHKARVISVMMLDPRRRHEEFDLIATPSYEPHMQAANVMTTIGTVNDINPGVLEEALKKYKKGGYPDIKNAKLKTPYHGVLIGGRHATGNVSVEDARNLAAMLNQAVEKHGGSLLITVGERTELTTLEALKTSLKAPHYLYDIKRHHDAANPYDAILALSAQIVVTGDSLRMCSEACSSGSAVYIFVPADKAFNYAPLHKELVDGGYAHFFTGEFAKGKEAPKVLDEAGRVAQKILELVEKS